MKNIFGWLPVKTDMAQYRALHFRRNKIGRLYAMALKKRIRERLEKYDWECKLPDQGMPYPPKPRIRYKLKLRRHYPNDRSLASILGMLVYK